MILALGFIGGMLLGMISEDPEDHPVPSQETVKNYFRFLDNSSVKVKKMGLYLLRLGFAENFFNCFFDCMPCEMDGMPVWAKINEQCPMSCMGCMVCASCCALGAATIHPVEATPVLLCCAACSVKADEECRRRIQKRKAYLMKKD